MFCRKCVNCIVLGVHSFLNNSAERTIIGQRLSSRGSAGDIWSERSSSSNRSSSPDNDNSHRRYSLDHVSYLVCVRGKFIESIFIPFCKLVL